MPLSSAHKRMLNIMLITTAIMPQFKYNSIIFNVYISIARLQPVMFWFSLHYAVVLLNLTYYAHEKTYSSFNLYQGGMITVSQKCFL